MNDDDLTDDSTDDCDVSLAELHSLEEHIGEIKEIERLLGGGFNLFAAAGMGSSEIRHCRFLAFLLDPKAAHEAGILFLRALLMECLNDGMKRAIADFGDLTQAAVRTEVHADSSGRIDIFIDIPCIDSAKRWAILIEAKINANEGENQTERYVEWAEREYAKSHDITYLYLTKNRDGARNGNFQPISWDAVSRALSFVLNEPKSNLSSDIQVCVKHYLDLMKEQDIVMQTNDQKEARKLAQELYKAHTRAFDFIRLIATDTTPINNALRAALSTIEEFVVEPGSSQSYVRIYPKAIEHIKGVTLNTPRTSDARPLYIDISSNTTKRCKIELVVGTSRDNSFHNEQLVQALVKPLTKVKHSSQPDKSGWTPIWTYRKKFTGGRDEVDAYAQEVCKRLKESPLFTRLKEWTDAVRYVFPEERNI